MLSLLNRPSSEPPRFPEEGTLRPTGARVLAGTAIGVAVVAAVSIASQYPPLTALLLAGIPAFGAALVWALYWHPHVDISPAGMAFVNILRTTPIPWPAVGDFDLRYGLAVTTRWGTKESAWAIPRTMKRALPTSRQALPDPSAAARARDNANPLIIAVVDYHAELDKRGFLADPVLEDTAPQHQWNTGVIAALLLTAAWAAAAIICLQVR
ncbi:PH domain-containing protein [Brevibacterium luteolum]|uniref:PH domain-containing protein n=1 Tax=Brevibacterium luteolum TaxID=199591 RepID=UPI00223C1D30|nr:PH domain-containing protein [Brevibacterium luteolum]MCT1874417.1 PH domain-containing protein [Brevibacterium luteolum]MCT1889440.1 PH domain-containing protein [Brevibacterium luteolum]MCT1894093.1 PH domain-containing protein [Brevibacterium luteolum]MCT1924934.1 PH domain-containing protein [Brevibacterium luteolum]